MPFCSIFVPIHKTKNCEIPSSSKDDPVILNVDEFETIRLIDYEGKDQKSCALEMNVARTTVQSMYESARAKIAESLVEGRCLQIKGGEYDIRVSNVDTDQKNYQSIFADNLIYFQNEMIKIAVPSDENENVFAHFGRTKFFKIFSIENKQVKSSDMISIHEHGRGTLASYIKNLGVTVLLCGNIGLGAVQAFKVSGVIVISGLTGNINTIIKDFISKNLNHSEESLGIIRNIE